MTVSPGAAKLDPRPTLFVALGDLAEKAVMRVFDELQALAGQRFPYRFGFAQLRAHGDVAELRLVRRPTASGDWATGRAPLDRLWQQRPCEFSLPLDGESEEVEKLGNALLVRADALAGRQLRRLDEKLGVILANGPAEIVLVVDDDLRNLPWWQWAARLGELSRHRHRTIGAVMQQLPPATSQFGPTTPIELLQQDLDGRAPFTQLFFVASRDQQGSHVEPEQQVYLLAEFLMDRLRAESRQLRRELDKHQWVDITEDVSQQIISFTHRTFRFRPEVIVERLKAKFLWAELARLGGAATEASAGEPRESDGQANNPLLEILSKVATPHPDSYFAAEVLPKRATGPEALPQDRRWYAHVQATWRSGEADASPGWPPIGRAQVQALAEQYETQCWHALAQALEESPLDLDRLEEIVCSAERQAMEASQRLHLDTERMTRIVRQEALDPHFRAIPAGTKEVTNPNKDRALFFVLAAIAGTLALISGSVGLLGAMKASLWSWTGLALLLIAIGLVILATRCKDKLRQVPLFQKVPRETPFELRLVQFARSKIAELTLRLSKAVADIDAVQRQVRGILESGGPLPFAPLHDTLTDDELERLNRCVPPPDDEQFARAKVLFGNRVARAIRGEEPISDVLDWIDGRFRARYRFLDGWDVDRVMRAARGESCADWKQNWEPDQAASWEVQDEQCCDRFWVDIDSQGNQPPREDDASERFVRLYKFCRGVVMPDQVTMPTGEPSPQD